MSQLDNPNSPKSREASKDYYRNLARNYETEAQRFVPGYETMTSTITRDLHGFLPEDSVVVDLGAGPGHMSEFISTYLSPRKLYIVDSEHQMQVAAVKQFAPRKDDPLRGELVFVETDARMFKPDESVDAVVSNLVIHNIPKTDKAKLLSHIHQYLKPGGKFIWGDLVVLEDPAEQRAAVEERKEHALRSGADPEFVELNFKKEGEEDYPLSETEMRQLLEQAGFTEIEELWRGTTFVVLSAVK
jgi:tRNA (cmo5U34)-methyltransferase